MLPAVPAVAWSSCTEIRKNKAQAREARPGGGVMLVLDAGAFVAVKHGDSDVVTLVSGCGWRGGCR